MKTIIIALILLFSLNSWAECPLNFERANLCASIEWLDGPYYGEVSHFRLQFWQADDLSQQPIVPQADFKVYSWMIMHGGHSHPGPPFNLVESGVGIYEVVDARFMQMNHGYWLIRVDFMAGEEVLERAEEKVFGDE